MVISRPEKWSGYLALVLIAVLAMMLLSLHLEHRRLSARLANLDGGRLERELLEEKVQRLRAELDAVTDQAANSGDRSARTRQREFYVEALLEALTAEHRGEDAVFTGDFDGNSHRDLAILRRTTFNIFDNLEAFDLDAPDRWRQIHWWDPLPVTVRKRASLSGLDDLALAIPPDRDVVVLGLRAPIVYFWDDGEQSFMWVQSIPREVADLAAAARRDHPEAFKLGGNNKADEFYGERSMRQYFIGRFGRSAELSLVVLADQTFYHYRHGQAVRKEATKYDPGKAFVRQNDGALEVESFEGDTKRVIYGDYIDGWIPEASAVMWHLDAGDTWEMIWTGD